MAVSVNYNDICKNIKALFQALIKMRGLAS